MFNFDAFTNDSEIAKKLLIGSLLAVTGIGLLAVLGWMIEIMRRVQNGEDAVLPDFDDIGGYFLDGLRATAVAFLWSLPIAIVVTLLSLGIAFMPEMFASEDDAAVAIVILTLCIVGLVFLFVVPMLILLVPAMGLLAETGSIREAISISRVIRIFRMNPGGFIIAGLLGSLINSLLASVGTILCIIGIFPASVVSYALQGQLYGNAYLDARRSGEGAFPK